MNISIDSISPVKKKVNFEIPAETVSAEIAKVYDEISRHASIKGFRKGKVPRSLIEKHYADRMKDQVLKNLIDSTCYRGLQENKVAAVAAPEIEADVIIPGEPLKYSAIVEVFPEVEVKDYAGLELEKEKFEEDASVIENRLNQLRENMAQLKPVAEDRPIATGDFVTFDFTGFVNGLPLDQGAAEDFELEIGSGRFIPGFEDQMVGMQRGESGSINLLFPEEYGNPEIAGKPARFDVVIKEIKAKELPALDDDFAKEMGEFETVDQLRAKMGEVYRMQEEARIAGQLKDAIVGALIERNPFDVPDSMIQRQLGAMLENMKGRLAAQRMTLEMAGMSEGSFMVQYRDIAANQVRGSILLDAVGTKEGIEVTDADIEAKMRKIVEETGQDYERIAGYYGKNPNARENLAAQVREEKVLEYLASQAVITEAPRKANS